MTMLLSRPTFSVDVSGKMTWVEPADEVWMRSLCSTSVPITSVRDAPPGGVPVEAGLTAPTLPTFCCCAPACDNGATVVSRKVSRRVRYEGVRQSMKLPLEASRRSDHDREIVLR